MFVQSNKKNSISLVWSRVKVSNVIKTELSIRIQILRTEIEIEKYLPYFLKKLITRKKVLFYFPFQTEQLLFLSFFQKCRRNRNIQMLTFWVFALYIFHNKNMFLEGDAWRELLSTVGRPCRGTSLWRHFLLWINARSFGRDVGLSSALITVIT